MALDDKLNKLKQTVDAGKVQVMTLPDANRQPVDVGAIFAEMGTLAMRSHEVTDFVRDRLFALFDKMQTDHVLPLVPKIIEQANVITDGTVASLDDTDAPVGTQRPPDSLTAISNMGQLLARLHRSQAETSQMSAAMNAAFLTELKAILADARKRSITSGTGQQP